MRNLQNPTDNTGYTLPKNYVLKLFNLRNEFFCFTGQNIKIKFKYSYFWASISAFLSSLNLDFDEIVITPLKV